MYKSIRHITREKSKQQREQGNNKENAQLHIQKLFIEYTSGWLISLVAVSKFISFPW
jgi:hypothetical protein